MPHYTFQSSRVRRNVMGMRLLICPLLYLSFFTWFGVDLLLVALMVLVVVGFGSSLLANIPLVQR